jgi:hypothetical protein
VALSEGYSRAFLVAGLLLLVGAGLATLIRTNATTTGPGAADQPAETAPTTPVGGQTV